MYNSSNMFNKTNYSRDSQIGDTSFSFGNSGFNVNSSVNGYPRSNSAMFSNNFNYLNNGDNINYSQPANNNLSFRTFQYNNNVNNLINVSNYLNNYPYNSVNVNQQINNIPNNYSNIYGNNFTTPQNMQSYNVIDNNLFDENDSLFDEFESKFAEGFVENLGANATNYEKANIKKIFVGDDYLGGDRHGKPAMENMLTIKNGVCYLDLKEDFSGNIVKSWGRWGGSCIDKPFLYVNIERGRYTVDALLNAIEMNRQHKLYDSYRQMNNSYNIQNRQGQITCNNK